MKKIKLFLLISNMLFSFILMAHTKPELTWKEKTKINLDILYKEIKNNSLIDNLGKIYGTSLNKVKNVQDQDSFNKVINEFSGLLKNTNIKIQNKNSLSTDDTTQNKIISKLPYGNFVLIIDKQ